MTARDQITEMVAAEQKTIVSLRNELRTLQGRASGFDQAVAALNGSDPNGLLRRKLEEKAKKERGAIAALNDRVADAEGKLSALEESLKLVGRDQEDGQPPEIRAGTELASAREIIREHGKPMHIGEILAKLTKPDTKANRANLRGSIGRYARESRIFVQTAPSTFGLVEFGVPGIIATDDSDTSSGEEDAEDSAQ